MSETFREVPRRYDKGPLPLEHEPGADRFVGRAAARPVWRSGVSARIERIAKRRLSGPENTHPSRAAGAEGELLREASTGWQNRAAALVFDESFR